VDVPEEMMWEKQKTIEFMQECNQKDNCGKSELASGNSHKH
jgi:hypothetical protein